MRDNPRVLSWFNCNIYLLLSQALHSFLFFIKLSKPYWWHVKVDVEFVTLPESEGMFYIFSHIKGPINSYQNMIYHIATHSCRTIVNHSSLSCYCDHMSLFSSMLVMTFISSTTSTDVLFTGWNMNFYFSCDDFMLLPIWRTNHVVVKMKM